MPPLISLVIPTMNQVKLVEKCLNTFFENQKLPETFPYEIVVVDDGSPKPVQRQLQSAMKQFPVKLILKTGNTGFASTVNRGIKESQGRIIALINNDIQFVSGNCLTEMVREAQRRSGAIIGGRLLYPDGRIQHGGIYYRPSLRVFDHEYRYKPADFKPALQTREVFGVTGALMVFDRGIWKKLKGMDERFFISWEDVDFCMRAWAAGFSVVYLGRAFAVHAEGKTRFNRASPNLAFWHKKEIETKKLFYAKWLKQLGVLNGVKAVPSGSISAEQAKRWRLAARPGKGGK